MKFEIKTHNWVQEGKSGTNFWVYENDKLILEPLVHNGFPYERKATFDSEEEAKSLLAYYLTKELK